MESLTRHGGILGTPLFMAPEQFSDPRNVDQRADIYSLGCTLYFLLTGEPPFHGENPYQLFEAHSHDPIPSIRAKRQDVSEGVDGIFSKMVQKAREDRYRACLEAIVALENSLWANGARVLSDDEAELIRVASEFLEIRDTSLPSDLVPVLGRASRMLMVLELSHELDEVRFWLRRNNLPWEIEHSRVDRQALNQTRQEIETTSRDFARGTNRLFSRSRSWPVFHRLLVEARELVGSSCASMAAALENVEDAAVYSALANAASRAEEFEYSLGSKIADLNAIHAEELRHLIMRGHGLV
jgi:serine/threonine protein kinase